LYSTGMPSFTLPPLYPILDAASFPSDLSERSIYLTTTVAELAQVGITILQLRAKQSTPDQILRDAATIRAVAPPALRLILNDHPALARQAGFDGVHLGQQDESIEVARRLLGPGAIIGLSTHTEFELIAANRTSADYLATGPVFPTQSKADASPAIGLAGVRRARALTQKPLVAIGGITLSNASSVWQAGAHTLALISALFASASTSHHSPGTIAQDFLRLFK
jgi:thiamine-phosphate pyrophosphorylase